MFRRLRSRRPYLVRCVPRGDFRLPRSKRCGEDHRHADALRIEFPHFGRGVGRRLRCAMRRRADQTPYRVYEPAFFAVQRPERLGKHGSFCRNLRAVEKGDGRTRRRTARETGFRLGARHPCGGIAAGLEAEAVVRYRHHPPPRGGFSG